MYLGEKRAMALSSRIEAPCATSAQRGGFWVSVLQQEGFFLLGIVDRIAILSLKIVSFPKILKPCNS